MNMYHNKEIMNSMLSIIVGLPESEAEREKPILSKIRFGELEVGDKFVFDGCWLVKTSEYRAESDKKRGKNHFLFFKKHIVQHEYLGDSCHDEADSHLLLHENGSDQATKFFTPKTGRFADKYDLFDDHHDMIKVQRPESKLCLLCNSDACKNASKWVIVIQSRPESILTIRENDVIVSSQDILSDIHGFWDAKVKIMGFDMVLTYDGKQRFTLSYNDEMVWSSPFNHSWDYVECCVISINNEIALMR